MIEIILGIATILGGITAIWFFFDKYKEKKENLSEPEQVVNPPNQINALPVIQIILNSIDWAWGRELDYSASGEDWNTLNLIISFTVRNTGTPVSIVHTQIDIPNFKSDTNPGSQLVDSANQAIIQFEWEVYDDYSGYDEEKLMNLPSETLSGVLNFTDSIGNEYSYSFKVPPAPKEYPKSTYGF